MEPRSGRSPAYENWEEVYRTHAPESLPWELGRARPQLVELIQRGTVVAEGKALDLCCGLGTNTIYLAQAGFEVCAIDIAPTAIGYARKKAELAGVRVRFRTADATKLPFADAQFDFALDMGCFHHITLRDRPRYLGGIHRVLKPAGKYFLICFSDRNGAAWNYFSEADIETLFGPYLDILQLGEFVSEEGDRHIRHFRTALMAKEK